MPSFSTGLACRPSLTLAGVPVIWHDNYVVFGDEANPTSCRIADLTSQAFRQLAPINVSRATAAADTGVLLGGSPTSSSASLASLESFACSTASSAASAATSTTSSGTTRLLRKHRNDTPAEPHEPTLRSWQCEQEDHFPTLAEVFAGIPPSVAFDLEIKMAVPDDVVVTPAHEVDRMVSATLAAVDAGLAAHGPRTIMFSSFDPEVCLEVKRRCVPFVVLWRAESVECLAVESFGEVAAGHCLWQAGVKHAARQLLPSPRSCCAPAC